MLLRIVGARRWRVLAACTERGECPLLDMLWDLQGKLRKDGDKMLAILQRASEEGPQGFQDVISHQLKGPIYEFIAGQIRVLWFYDDGKVVICTHGFVKKGQKTPVRDIEHAEGVRAEYIAAKSTGKIEFAGD